MSKITQAAKDRICTARIPGVCNHDRTTSVWAHINSVRWGSGKGIKSPDICGLIVCSACHDVIDRRVKSTHDRDFIMRCVYEGHMESLMILCQEGIV